MSLHLPCVVYPTRARQAFLEFKRKDPQARPRATWRGLWVWASVGSHLLQPPLHAPRQAPTSVLSMSSFVVEMRAHSLVSLLSGGLWRVS